MADAKLDDGVHVLDFKFKVIVVGDEGVGKTAMINRYVHDCYVDVRPSIGVDFALKVLKEDARTTAMHLWDVAGQVRDMMLLQVYFKSAVGVFVVFDVTSQASFERAKAWKRDIDDNLRLVDGSPVPVVLLANKCDLKTAAEVDLTPAVMQQFCREYGFVGWFETSAKMSLGIDDAGRSLLHAILENETRFAFTERVDGPAHFPQCRRANGLIYVSGICPRRLDNSYAGVAVREDGSFELDIKAQTRAVIENIGVILHRVGASLANIIDLQVFLVNMDDYPGMNEVYNEFFDVDNGPTRTTVAVHQLPNPAKLLVEIKVIARDPSSPPAAPTPVLATITPLATTALAVVGTAVVGALAYLTLGRRRGCGCSK